MIYAICLSAFLITTAPQDTSPPPLAEAIAELASYLPVMNQQSSDISAVPVAWHLDHSLKVIIGVYDSLEISAPQRVGLQLNASRAYMYLTGSIPRGRLQSPSSVLPPDIITVQAINEQIETARARMQSWNTLERDLCFEHDVVGKMNTRQTLRFLEIHTEHHLKIIRDILSAENSKDD